MGQIRPCIPKKNPGRQPHSFNAHLSCCTKFLVPKKYNPESDRHTLALSDTSMFSQVYVRRICFSDLLETVGILKVKLSETMKK